MKIRTRLKNLQTRKIAVATKISLILDKKMKFSPEADFQSDGWTCPACHNDYSQNTRKLRHLRHCSVIRSKLEEDEEQTSPEEIERLIQHYRAQLTDRKKTRCTCQFGYHFCEEIVGDINWDAEMFLVLVPQGHRVLKYVR